LSYSGSRTTPSRQSRRRFVDDVRYVLIISCATVIVAFIDIAFVVRP
jgi:hypothetical protein